MNKKNLILSIAILGLLACSKEDPAPAKSKEELLTNNNSKIWKKTETSTNGIPETLQDCEKDNTYTFKSDNKLDFGYGTNKCSSIETDNTGSWKFNQPKDSLTITIKITSGSTTVTNDLKYKILELSESKLKLTLTYTFSGTAFTKQETYTP